MIDIAHDADLVDVPEPMPEETPATATARMPTKPGASRSRVSKTSKRWSVKVSRPGQTVSTRTTPKKATPIPLAEAQPKSEPRPEPELEEDLESKLEDTLAGVLAASLSQLDTASRFSCHGVAIRR